MHKYVMQGPAKCFKTIVRYLLKQRGDQPRSPTASYRGTFLIVLYKQE